MRSRLCKVCNGWHDIESPWPVRCIPSEYLDPKRSSLSAPNVVRDDLPDLKSMVDGKRYTSKGALRRSYKAHGVVEVGNDAPIAPVSHRKRITKAEIGEAIQKVRQGYKPAPLEHGVLHD